MNTQKINNIKQIIGFFSMTIAWTLMNFLNSLNIAIQDGHADDSGVIIFWSGLFIAIAWAIFIIFPISQLNHKKKYLKPIIFPILTTIYGGIVYAIIVGAIFRSIDLIFMFLPLALLAGLIFGVSYSLLINSRRVVNFLYKNALAKGILILSPAIFLFTFLWLLPATIPSLVFRYVPDTIRYKIVAQTIPKFKVGDKFEPLKESLPGYFNIDESGGMSATMENFSFVIQINGGKITRLEYGNHPTDIDNTIYGTMKEQPSP